MSLEGIVKVDVIWSKYSGSKNVLKGSNFRSFLEYRIN